MRRWILYALLASALLAGGLWASTQEKPKEEPDIPDFEPSEKVPADSSVSFPVDI